MPADCILHKPGHQPYWIQVKNATDRSPGTVIEVRRDGWITLALLEGTRRLWTHDTARLEAGMPVQFSDAYSLVIGPSGQAISGSDAPTACNFHDPLAEEVSPNDVGLPEGVPSSPADPTGAEAQATRVASEAPPVPKSDDAVDSTGGVLDAVALLLVGCILLLVLAGIVAAFVWIGDQSPTLKALLDMSGPLIVLPVLGAGASFFWAMEKLDNKRQSL
jgi:hypothetical protein